MLTPHQFLTMTAATIFAGGDRSVKTAVELAYDIFEEVSNNEVYDRSGKILTKARKTHTDQLTAQRSFGGTG